MTPWPMCMQDTDNMIGLTASSVTDTSPTPLPPRRSGKRPSRVDLPGYTYAELIAMAIQSAPSGMMTITEIQQFMRDSFDCFRTSYSGWRNSIRHNLSARECFYKVPMVKGASRGRTHYWTLNQNCSHCRGGNDLIRIARQWRWGRLMSNRRRTAKKLGSSVTCNADGLGAKSDASPRSDSSITQTRASRSFISSNISPHRLREEQQRGSLSQPSPSPTPRDGKAPSPACSACSDGVLDDCDHCVLLDIGEAHSPAVDVTVDDTHTDFHPVCRDAGDEVMSITDMDLEEGRRILKFGERLLNADVDGIMPIDKFSMSLDDLADDDDLLQTDDSIDLSLYDVDGGVSQSNHEDATSNAAWNSTSGLENPLDLSIHGLYRVSRSVSSKHSCGSFQHSPKTAGLYQTTPSTGLDLLHRSHFSTYEKVIRNSNSQIFSGFETHITGGKPTSYNTSCADYPRQVWGTATHQDIYSRRWEYPSSGIKDQFQSGQNAVIEIGATKSMMYPLPTRRDVSPSGKKEMVHTVVPRESSRLRPSCLIVKEEPPSPSLPASPHPSACCLQTDRCNEPRPYLSAFSARRPDDPTNPHCHSEKTQLCRESTALFETSFNCGAHVARSKVGELLKASLDVASAHNDVSW